MDSSEQVVSVALPELEKARVAQLLTIGAELAAAYPSNRAALNCDTQITLAVADDFTAGDLLEVRHGPTAVQLACLAPEQNWLQALKVRTQLMQRFAAIWKTADVLVTPTIPVTAPMLRHARVRL